VFFGQHQVEGFLWLKIFPRHARDG
jgi:hypothetical protein